MKRKIKLTACLMALIAVVAFGFTGCMYIDGNDGQWHSWGPNCNDTNYTGMDCNEYGWWYFQNGVIDWNYTGMACNENGWWYFRNGQIDWGYTGMACNQYGWWYYQNGRLDWGYNGFGFNEYGGWLYQNGTIAWNYTGDYGNYYIKGGHLDHEHNASKVINQKAATYTANGYTGDKVCSHCGKLMQKGTTIAKLVKYETRSEEIHKKVEDWSYSERTLENPNGLETLDSIDTVTIRHYYSDGSYTDETVVTHSDPYWDTYWKYLTRGVDYAAWLESSQVLY